MVQKLGQSTLVKVDFKGLTSTVAFVDFFTSVMAFTPRLTFPAAWLTSAVAFKAIKVVKYAKNAPYQADNFANFSVMLMTKNQVFRCSAGSDLQAIDC